MRAQTLILFGRSGSGKGTQAGLLLDYMNQNNPERKTLYIETGQKFREFIAKENHTANLTKEVMNAGGLMPEFMPIWIWTNFLIENFTGDEHLVLDGLSRRPHEAPILDSALKFYKREYPTIIALNVGREWATERLLGRGREDDKPEDIKKRVEWYDTNVIPAIEYFRNNGRFTVLDINGERSKEEVHKEIIEKINWN